MNKDHELIFFYKIDSNLFTGRIEHSKPGERGYKQT